MFDQIAPTYDRANHLLSFSIDRYWRWRTVRTLRRLLPPAPLGAAGAAMDASAGAPINARAQAPILDICCGTGDLTLALRAGLRDRPILGADFSAPMLTRAAAKTRHPGAPARRGDAAAPGPAPISWLQADALHLPFPPASLAAIAAGFGFRNLSDYRAGLAEFLRLLQPGGVLAILEVSRPALPLLGRLYSVYFERILPRLGGWISGHPDAYRYLPESVGRFPAPPTLAAWMRDCGFTQVRYRRLAGGIAVLHTAAKPCP